MKTRIYIVIKVSTIDGQEARLPYAYTNKDKAREYCKKMNDNLPEIEEGLFFYLISNLLLVTE